MFGKKKDEPVWVERFGIAHINTFLVKTKDGDSFSTFIYDKTTILNLIKGKLSSGTFVLDGLDPRVIFSVISVKDTNGIAWPVDCIKNCAILKSLDTTFKVMVKKNEGIYFLYPYSSKNIEIFNSPWGKE